MERPLRIAAERSSEPAVDDDYEDWQDLQAVLEERDVEYWADEQYADAD